MALTAVQELMSDCAESLRSLEKSENLKEPCKSELMEVSAKPQKTNLFSCKI